MNRVHKVLIQPETSRKYKHPQNNVSHLSQKLKKRMQIKSPQLTLDCQV